MPLPWLNNIIIVLSALLVLILALGAVPWVFPNHVLPGVTLGSIKLAGVPYDNLEGVLAQYEATLAPRTVTLVMRDEQATHSLAELGLTVDRAATRERVTQRTWRHIKRGEGRVTPVIRLDHSTFSRTMAASFASVLTLPQDASLRLTSSSAVEVVPGKAGEGINIAALTAVLATQAVSDQWEAPITLAVVEATPEVQDHEVEAARAFASTLMREGMDLRFNDQHWTLTPFTLRRLIVFTPQLEAGSTSNYILGVTLKADELADYFDKTLVPEINRTAQDARFIRRDDGLVEQFAIAQAGQELDIAATTAELNRRVAAFEREADVAVTITEPLVASNEDIQALGITTLLAQGESNFAGSPRNRIHNITVGTTRYHGLLLPPGEEFSFNAFLGPVDAAHNFKPELVIKHNVTIPEFGGGLCQVSTTLFRAAVHSGLEITARRNHAYPVRYYGTPGFDATIYPPYTDLRFTNNTPGYILIQSRLEGTNLTFEFWGTDDGREVAVEGPTPYDRQPDGSVKATLRQTVTRAGETVIDKTFYSRYKSPSLFPKAVTANDPTAATPPLPTPVPPSANAQSTATVSPTPAAAPASAP